MRTFTIAKFCFVSRLAGDACCLPVSDGFLIPWTNIATVSGWETTIVMVVFIAEGSISTITSRLVACQFVWCTNVATHEPSLFTGAILCEATFQIPVGRNFWKRIVIAESVASFGF